MRCLGLLCSNTEGEENHNDCTAAYNNVTEAMYFSKLNALDFEIVAVCGPGINFFLLRYHFIILKP